MKRSIRHFFIFFLPPRRITYFSLLLVIAGICNSSIAVAGHVFGAEFSYQYIGPNQYLVNFIFYRDCSGIPAPNTIYIDIANNCGYADTSALLTLDLTSPDQISPICPSGNTTCTGGVVTGIEKYHYSGIVSLPGPCSDWTISHTESARYYTNTTGSAGNLFVYTTINNANGIINNSPVFSANPVPIMCSGQPFCISNIAVDLEGDSLVYEIITPRTGPVPGDTITFLPGYSALQPLVSNPLATFNSTTGEFCFHPTQSDGSIIATLVKEYRSGVLIGQIERDVGLIVVNCLNHLPNLTGVNNTAVNILNACANDTVRFNFSSYDPDSSDTTVITWDNGIPGASFITSQSVRDTAYFYWVPSPADTGHTNFFTATVRDNACPLNGINTRSFIINVSDCPLLSADNFADLAENDILIYPNPVNDKVTIKFKDISKGRFQIRLINIIGKIIYTNEFSVDSIGKEITADLKCIPAGIYFINIASEMHNRIYRLEKL